MKNVSMVKDFQFSDETERALQQVQTICLLAYFTPERNIRIVEVVKL
jgi:hypothetical protein